VSGKQKAQVRNRRSREEVERLTIEFEASGLRLMEFCRKHGLPPSTLQRHLKRRRSLGNIEAKQDDPLVAAALPGMWQRECTRRLRFTSGVILRLEDRGVAEFRFGHTRTTAQRIGEDQSSQIG
jgi:hypothetical protein